jgi:hypothetical protein
MKKTRKSRKVTGKISLTKVDMENLEIRACADTGCPQNLIGEHTFNRIQKSRLKRKVDQIKLKKSTIVLRPYCTKEPIPIIGKFKTVIESQNKMTAATVYVVKGDADNLLSRQTSEELGIVKIN